MTDTSSLITTHSTAQPFPVTVPSQASPLPNGSLSDTNLPDDEDYTIKCICAYADDDGNTVLCEKCDTWQHIECYYTLYGQAVPEVHLCADCSPRELDPKRATERQKRRREQKDDGDRKVKRPTSKSHKKKTKDVATEQINGWHTHERHDSVVNGKDLSYASKKPKNTHRTSGSIASVNGTSTGETRKRAFSNVQSYPSPSKSPQDLFRFPSVPMYTSDFLELYDRDEGSSNVSRHGENVYTIPASNELSLLKANPTLVANGESLITYSDQPLDPLSWPSVDLDFVEKLDTEIDGKHPSWRLLRAQSEVKKDNLVGEIRGQVGLLEEYCRQESSSNRWNDLYHPDPFVFFHPHIPIYIDSRREGTEFRYLRRSCRPNVTLKTFVTTDGTYHHCFVASRSIPAGAELTTSWYLHSAVFNNEGLVGEVEELQNKKIKWASNVLANFGDCACGRPEDCPLANLDRRYLPRSLEAAPPKQIAGRKRKTKSKHAISPLSTGQATNSRAGSEVVKPQDEDDQFDRRSNSTSSRSHPRSRDVTPSNTAILDANPMLGNDLTARERRKIAAVEKQFEKAEQGTQEKKKKKRTSGGSTLNTPSVGASKQLGLNGSNPSTPNMTHPFYDSKTSRPFSGSPPPLRSSTNHVDPMDSPCRPSSSKSVQPPTKFQPAPTRPSYVNVSIQTDPEEPEALEMPQPKRRKFSTPTQRLLRRVLEDRAKFEQSQQSPEQFSALSPPSPFDQVPTGQRRASVDVEMRDAGNSVMSSSTQSPRDLRSPSESPKVSNDGPAMSPPFSMPSQAAHSQKPPSQPPGPRLHLSTLPPVPTFSTSAFAPTPGSLVPSGATPSTAQSPMSFGLGGTSFPLSASNMTSPSPIRKKLSLGDYMSRINLSATPVTEKSQAQAGISGDRPQEPESQDIDGTSLTDSQSMTLIKPNDKIKEEAAAMAGADGSALDDTPMKDEDDYSPPGVSPAEPVVAELAVPTEAADHMSTDPAAQPQDKSSVEATMSPEVENVLAQLRQIHAMQGSIRADSASST